MSATFILDSCGRKNVCFVFPCWNGGKGGQALERAVLLSSGVSRENLRLLVLSRLLPGCRKVEVVRK